MVTLTKLAQFGSSFQTKVIGRLLTSKTFLTNVVDSLSADFFENKQHEWIITTIVNYYNEYHTYPSIDKMNIEVKKVENEVLKIAITEQLREAYKVSETASDLPWVEAEFQNFCTNQQVKKAIMTSVDLLDLGDYDGIKSLINNALKANQDKNIGHIYERDIETRYREDSRSPIPFPWNAFNGITEGGVGKGELVLIFGNPKGGKSWAVVSMAAKAMLEGFNVVYYTLELSESYVGRRIDACLTGIPINELSKRRKEVEAIVNKVKGKIRIKEYPAGRASLDTIEAHLQQLEVQDDFVPHMIIIDYLDLLKNRNKGRKDQLADTNDIFVDARGLAREYQVPLISPSQIGRAGANDDIIQADKIAGSYAKVMIADFAVSLSRKRKDKMEGTGRWHIMGNRMGPDGLTFASKIDTSCGRIEIFEKALDEDFDESDKFSNDASGVDSYEKGYIKNNFFKT